MQIEQFQLHARIEEEHWWFCARRRIMVALANRLTGGIDHQTIVDVGCGTGANIAALSRQHTCVGFDTSRYAIESAKARYPQVHFICSRYPEDSTIDQTNVRLVLLMDVLEHIQDDSRFLSNLVSSQNKGTYILIMVPADRELWSCQDVNHGHFRRYQLDGLRTILEELPVGIHLLSYFNSYLYPVVRVLRMLNRLFGRTWGEAGTDLKIPSTFTNKVLERIFFHESQFLLRALAQKRRSGFPFGVSLIAIIRKQT